ncbi:hypothetical protein ABPG72_014026 [Tetrahymena utriculariae]
MRIKDKKDNQQKIIEIFSQDQLQETLDLFISYAQQSKLLSEKKIVLNILDSYFLDEDMLFYIIEYEDFDFFCQNVNSIQYFNIQNKLDCANNSQFQSELLDNYLYEIYKYSIESLSPSSLSRCLEKSLFISKGYFIFLKYEDQLLVKLNTVDPYLFQEYFSNILQPQYQIGFQINQKIYFAQLNAQVQQTFLSQIEEKYPKFKQNNSIILQNIVNDEDKYLLLKLNEQENSCLIKSIQNNKLTYIQVQKYSTFQEVNQYMEKCNSLIDQINQTYLKANTEQYDIVIL